MVRRRSVVLGAVLTAVALVSAGCSMTVSGSPAPDPNQYVSVHEPADLPYLGADGKVERAFTRMRTWDVCAMHDVKAAEAITKDTVIAVEPSVDLSTCTAGAAKDGEREWNLQISLVNFMKLQKKMHPGGVVKGKLVYRRLHDYGCGYVLPYQEVAGISVEVGTTGGKKADESTCELAKQYLAAIMPKLAQPPSLNAMLTMPRMELAGKDPCAALAAAKRRLGGRSVKGIVLNPYSCTLSATGGSGKDSSVLFAFTKVGSTADEARAVSAGGLTGYRKKSRRGCTFAFPVGQPLVVGRYSGTGYQEMLRITVPSCDMGATVEKMVTALHVRPRPAPQHPELRLGVDTGKLAKAAGAPFDPCRLVGWGAFPKPVTRGKHLVHPNHFKDGSLLKVGCSFHSKEIDTIIGWGDTGKPDDIRKHKSFKDAKPVTIADHQVLRANLGKSCLDAVVTGKGFVGVSTEKLADGSAVDPCELNTKLITKFAPRLP